VYSQQVFLDKFTFSCVQSTSFPWQVYFLVCTVNKFPFTSLPSRVCTVNKFPFTSLPSRVCGQQVFLDKFPLKCFVACVHEMLLNIYLTSRPPSVCQNHRRISCQVFLGETGMTSVGTRLLGKEKLSTFSCTHEQIKRNCQGTAHWFQSKFLTN
jgi:hypothetical protein